MKQTRIANLLLVVLLASPGGAVAQPRGEVALRAAMETETVKGDLKGAIRQYEKVTQGNDRAIAAKALVRMAGCYTKLGDAQAEKVYRRVLREFADQTQSSDEARKALAALGGAGTSDKLAKRRLCAGCDIDEEANISPDGRWIVMTEWAASGDLAIRDMSTGEVKRLMAKTGTWKNSAEYAETPVFSPDLRHVVYHWETGEPQRHNQLRIIANEPAAKPRVLIDTRDNRYNTPLAWSTDRKSVLVNFQKLDQTWQLAWVSVSDGAIKGLRSLEWRLRATGTAPRLSPDGRYIAYSALATNPKSATAPVESTEQWIYLLAADGSGETELVKTACINSNPVWTPDGKHLLFTSDRSGSFALWSVPVRNGKAAGSPSLVTQQIGVIYVLGMTRAGTYYYVQRERELEYAAIVDMKSATQARVSRVPARFAGIRPMWSPDGKRLAFTRRRGRPGRDNYDLVVQTAETGEEAVYSFPGILPVAARWLPDGKTVVVPVNSPGKTGLYRVDLKTKEFKNMLALDPALSPRNFELSLDGTTLYVANRNPETSRPDRILAVDLDTGQRRDIANIPSPDAVALYPFRLSPDGRTLAVPRYNREDKKIHIARVSVDGSDYREIYRAPGRNTGDIVAWTNDGGSVLFEDRLDGNWRIMRLLADGGQPEFTGLEGIGTLQSVDVARDGSRIVYNSRQNISELWALDNVLSVLK